MNLASQFNPFQEGDEVVCVGAGHAPALTKSTRYKVDGPYGADHIYLVNTPGGPYKTSRFERYTGVPEDAFQVPATPSPAQPRLCYHCKDGTQPCVCPAGIQAEIGRMPKLEAAVEANLGPGDVASLANDAVNLPSHYARFKIEPIRFLVENFGPVILVGKVVKYTMRYDAKNGLEDLRKAKRCLEMLIKHTEGDPDWWKRS